MAQSLPMKRMLRERRVLESDTSNYFVHFKDDDILSFDAYIIGPEGTLYEHKFVKLRFVITPRYPMDPPKVSFVQHSGKRIHPNLYVDGKVCLSILGTWQGEPWAMSMTCHTVLVTIRSLLDNSPYQHEPGCPDNPEFNAYVQYCTWRSLLLDYLTRETEKPAKDFLLKYVAENGSKMISELRQQELKTTAAGVHQLSSPYGKNFHAKVDYAALAKELTEWIHAAKGGTSQLALPATMSPLRTDREGPPCAWAPGQPVAPCNAPILSVASPEGMSATEPPTVPSKRKVDDVDLNKIVDFDQRPAQSLGSKKTKKERCNGQ